MAGKPKQKRVRQFKTGDYQDALRILGRVINALNPNYTFPTIDNPTKGEHLAKLYADYGKQATKSYVQLDIEG